MILLDKKMSANDLDSSDLKKQEELEDITTCCICTEVYTDPKALPCIHTFCMKCIQETGLKSNKGPEDEMPCPICRRLFKIPSEGFSGLPKNFFIERLIQVSKVTDPSAATKDLCSVCLEESKEQEGKETPTADTYCVDCKHKLCEECYKEHRIYKVTKNHKLIPINEYGGQNVMADLAPMVCEVHEQKVLDVYCADCKIVVCAICFIEEHKNHDGSHVNKCVDGFRKEIENRIEAMNGCISHAQLKKAELLKVKERMQERVESLECDIDNRKEQIKQFADKHASRLLQGLCPDRQIRLKEIQMATDDTDAYLSNLESYNSYCKRIIAKGSASDICSALSDLSIRAFELQQQCQPIIEREIEEFKFCFKQSELEELLEEDCSNLFGEIEEEGDLKPKDRSKQIPLLGQSNEIDILRQENKELRMQRAYCNAQIDKLKDELKNNTTINALQVSYDKLKQELDVEKTTNNSLQTRYEEEKTNYEARMEKLEEQMGVNKTANRELQAYNVKLKQELDVEKTTNDSLQISNDKEKADSKAHIEKLKQELENNKTEFSQQKVSNDKLKQELDVEKTTNNSLQANNDKFLEELDTYKANVTMETLEANAEQLRKELDKTKNQELEQLNKLLTKDLELYELSETLEAIDEVKGSETAEESKDGNATVRPSGDQTGKYDAEYFESVKHLTEYSGGRGLQKKPLRRVGSFSGGTSIPGQKRSTFRPSSKRLSTRQFQHGYKADAYRADDDQEQLLCRRDLGLSVAGISTAEKTERAPDPYLIKEIRTKASTNNYKAIHGLTILEDELFIISRVSSEIEVHDACRLILVRRVELKVLEAPWDIISCDINKCLYIMNWKKVQSKAIVRIDPNGNVIKQWSTGSNCGRLSITTATNIILAAYKSDKIIEYTAEGGLVREIKLPFKLAHPQHAIKLDSSRFLVIHGMYDDFLQRLCLLDGNGSVLTSFGGEKGSGKEHLHGPIYMAVDNAGSIFIAEYANSRVLLLSQSLQFKQVLLSEEMHGLRDPWSIHLDEANGRLFVVDNDYEESQNLLKDGRILAFYIQCRQLLANDADI